MTETMTNTMTETMTETMTDLEIETMTEIDLLDGGQDYIIFSDGHIRVYDGKGDSWDHSKCPCGCRE